jgi:sphingolipid 8-(E)-desaturase
MTERTYPTISRRQIEGLIAEGRSIFILDQYVVKADAWLPYHPGGDKAIRHMIGRDATDEVTALVLPYSPRLRQTTASLTCMFHTDFIRPKPRRR